MKKKTNLHYENEISMGAVLWKIAFSWIKIKNMSTFSRKECLTQYTSRRLIPNKKIFISALLNILVFLERVLKTWNILTIHIQYTYNKLQYKLNQDKLIGNTVFTGGLLHNVVVVYLRLYYPCSCLLISVVIVAVY